MCFCLYCLSNMLVLNNICLVAWELEHVVVEQHLSCSLTTWYLFVNLLLALLSLTATWNGWFACLPYHCLGLEYISLCQPWVLHGLYISIAAWIIFIVRKNMWLHSISGASQPLFFCLVAAVDFLMRLHDSTILLTNSWTFWSCEHFIRLL